MLPIIQRQFGQALQTTSQFVQQSTAGISQEMLQKYGDLYLKYQEFINRFNKLDWQYFKNIDENLSTLLRLASDYYYLEALAGNTEEMQRVVGQFQKTSEAVAKGHAVVGGVVSGLVATSVISAGLGAVIGGAVALFASVIQGQKAISMSGNRSDDLGNRLNRLNRQDEFQNNLYWKGIALLHARPKCRSVSSGCIKEHLQYVARVDIFNKVVEILLNLKSKLTFEKFLEDNGYKQVKQEIQKQVEIGKAEISEQKKAGVDWKVLIFIFLMIIVALIGFRGQR
jgi:hypothetical protein